MFNLNKQLYIQLRGGNFCSKCGNSAYDENIKYCSHCGKKLTSENGLCSCGYDNMPFCVDHNKLPDDSKVVYCYMHRSILDLFCTAHNDENRAIKATQCLNTRTKETLEENTQFFSCCGRNRCEKCRLAKPEPSFALASAKPAPLFASATPAPALEKPAPQKFHQKIESTKIGVYPSIEVKDEILSKYRMPYIDQSLFETYDENKEYKKLILFVDWTYKIMTEPVTLLESLPDKSKEIFIILYTKGNLTDEAREYFFKSPPYIPPLYRKPNIIFHPKTASANPSNYAELYTSFIAPVAKLAPVRHASASADASVSASMRGQPIIKKSVGVWNCPQCTFLNDPISLNCQMCGFYLGKEQIEALNRTTAIPVKRPDTAEIRAKEVQRMEAEREKIEIRAKAKAEEQRMEAERIAKQKQQPILPFTIKGRNSKKIINIGVLYTDDSEDFLRTRYLLETQCSPINPEYTLNFIYIGTIYDNKLASQDVIQSLAGIVIPIVDSTGRFVSDFQDKLNVNWTNTFKPTKIGTLPKIFIIFRKALKIDNPPTAARTNIMDNLKEVYTICFKLVGEPLNFHKTYPENTKEVILSDMIKYFS